MVDEATLWARLQRVEVRDAEQRELDRDETTKKREVVDERFTSHARHIDSARSSE